MSKCIPNFSELNLQCGYNPIPLISGIDVAAIKASHGSQVGNTSTAQDCLLRPGIQE
jgi:hypothetical protein